MMIATSQPTPLDEWRHRLGGRRRRARPRPFAALGYLTDGPLVDGLINVEKLTMVLLHDEPIRFGQCALRLAGHSGSRIPWGVCFGGRANCRFLKDLMLQPVPGGEGYRLDLANEEHLALGLQLDRDLDLHVRFHKPIRDRPSLPKLWAGFPPEIAASITGDGPELAAYSAQQHGPQVPVAATSPRLPGLHALSAAVGQPPLATGRGDLRRLDPLSQAADLPLGAT